ncbi:MAG: geranylgeranyl reductase family protein [Paucibacter sp.]|nr:geranylgeranyl reductase family protein [Roseateles sp.]
MPIELPSHCEVLVVGAGPAGSAAAATLARAGRSVLLVDQHPLGRDKVCGDGLIPDAHAALARMGMLDAVMARATRMDHVTFTGPRGGQLAVAGQLAVLPRRELDALLNEHAQSLGARFMTPARFEAPLVDTAGRVIGARLKGAEGSFEVRADWVLLATGANAASLVAAGVCERHTPSGVALRGYVQAPHLAEQGRGLEVVWSRALRPGYGWIFPAPGGIFNIGVGVADSHNDLGGKGRKKDYNLRELFEAFVCVYEPAARLMREGRLLGELKGAPLRCTLAGARWSRPGLLVIGEAAGSTYSLTGEGIGKALETGLLAADAVLAGEGAEERYERELVALRPKFELYQKANRINAHPWLAELLIWRGRRSPRLLQRMEGVLSETVNPGNLVSVRGLTRMLFT